MSRTMTDKPQVCLSARTVGVLKPTFDAASRGFKPPEITVHGTGFWIKGKNVFVTCAHVVNALIGSPIELAGMLIVGGNGVEYKRATVSAIDFSHDIAVLNIEAEDAFIRGQFEQGLEINEEEIEVSDKVAYAGFPLGNQLLNQRHSPTYAEGVIGQELVGMAGPKTIQISGPVVGGYSGSPIVLQDTGRVIGMVANSPSIEAGNASIFRAIHWKHLRSAADLMES